MTRAEKLTEQLNELDKQCKEQIKALFGGAQMIKPTAEKFQDMWEHQGAYLIHSIKFCTFLRDAGSITLVVIFESGQTALLEVKLPKEAANDKS